MKKDEINKRYTSIDDLPLKEETRQTIFLAGSIDSHLGSNWRTRATEQLNDRFQVFDPTNENHSSLTDLQMCDHINWELDALETADHILLNLLGDAKSPISLVELGMYVTSNKLLVVCPREFYESRYVGELCARYKTTVFINLEDAIAELNRNSKEIQI